MFTRSIILFLIVMYGTFGVAFAQNIPDTTDAGVYKKIEAYSARRKLTSLMHELLLRPVISTETPVHEVSDVNSISSYNNLEGKIIRNIHVVTLDPFGFSISDTTSQPHSYLEKTGNVLHIKTQNFTIRNQLLFHKNDPFDSLKVKESERLIRSQSYINDVLITAVATQENSDSVDVLIRANDLWSIIPDGALTTQRINLKLSDKNLGGTGHTFSYSYTQNYQNAKHAYQAYYLVPNIKNTFISTRLGYAIDENKNYNKAINIERPFFSPLTSWAGGILISQQKMPGLIVKTDTVPSKFNTNDVWGAAAWRIFKGKTETDRVTKMILTGRVLNKKYLEIPAEQPDLGDYYTSEVFYLSGLGISSRKYVKQSYVFRFGVTEDVPVGVAYGLVGGYQLKNNDRWYWGLYHSWGNFFRWGYFGTHLEYGTFLSTAELSESALNLGINYFSGLFSIGRWKFRQFVKPEFTIGIDRPFYDKLTINDGYGLNGFSSPELTGTRRLLIVIQTQSYAPWSLLGFRFGPYLNFSFGMLGDEKNGFGQSRLYPQLGIGVLIRNDYLVVKNMQISFAFYPAIPGDGNNIFKANPFRTTDFGFPDFVIGKPKVVDFQ